MFGILVYLLDKIYIYIYIVYRRMCFFRGYRCRKVAVSYKLTRWVHGYIVIDIGVNDIQAWMNMTMRLYRVEYVCIWVHIDVYSCDCMLNEYLSMNPAVCFCYRSRERGQEEAGGQADLTVELVPWETCSIAWVERLYRRSRDVWSSAWVYSWRQRRWWI